MKAILKHRIGNETINFLSELCLNSTGGYVQLPKVFKQWAKQHRSLVRTLA